ncbi:double zinc ribbon domain-containing protein [Alphaproteobacteria bacterium]|nr:double zinc ribbon domain-containing protein [Alphaproteobacteria bacterium]
MQTKTATRFRQHYNALLDLLLHQQCTLCRRFCFDHGLCADCWQGLVFITSPFCQRCGRPLSYANGDHLCGDCFAEAPPLGEIRSCFLYNDQSRQLILKFKHGDALHLTPLFARFLQAPFTALAEPDHLIVSIPLHAKRYLHRRFNQSAELARLLCQQNATGIFTPKALAQPKFGPTQAGLSRSQRQRNLVCRTSKPASPHHQPARAVD